MQSKTQMIQSINVENSLSLFSYLCIPSLRIYLSFICLFCELRLWNLEYYPIMKGEEEPSFQLKV